jgi:hypothetical protein
VFAEFETNLRRERQLEGIAKAKAAGVYKGRPASIDATQVREMKAQGMGVGDRQGSQNRPRVRLQGAGSRMIPSERAGGGNPAGTHSTGLPRPSTMRSTAKVRVVKPPQGYFAMPITGTVRRGAHSLQSALAGNNPSYDTDGSQWRP